MQFRSVDFRDVEVELFEDFDGSKIQVEIFNFYRICHEFISL